MTATDERRRVAQIAMIALHRRFLSEPIRRGEVRSTETLDGARDRFAIAVCAALMMIGLPDAYVDHTERVVVGAQAIAGIHLQFAMRLEAHTSLANRRI